MTNSIDTDITETLYKLQTLLEYSVNPKAETVADLILKAKLMWNGEENKSSDDGY